MFGTDRLKDKINKVNNTFVECPVKGCREKVKRQRKRFKRELEFMCKTHHIYISPTTFEYQDEFDNILWKDKTDKDLLKRIKGVKRECRMEHDNSEDAVTWNVFRFLERNKLLSGFLGKISKSPITNPEVIYWSYSQLQQKTWGKLLRARIEFGESPERSSEPDIIVKSDNTIFFIEAKLTATNDTTPSNPGDSKKYLTGGNSWFKEVFESDYQTIAISEQKYELLRFWLIGSWIAKQLDLDFYLVNLVLSERERDIKEIFKMHIKENRHRKFTRITWEEIYKYILSTKKANREKEAIIEYFRNKSIGYKYKDRHLQKAFLT
ncbi:MAG: hypothetical protein KAX20_03040 [Candidatus Omnitrophica bacterium]|nr:hypothetical protein [Candidatus Omnitrophota bacterium]